MFLELFLKTIFIYITVLFLIRLMGKREVGQLSAFDLVVAIIIAELAVLPMERQDLPMYVSIVPMFTLVGAEIMFSYLCLKSRLLRRIVNGSPSIIIADGDIIIDEMRRLRYNIDDLLSQLRINGVTEISEVDYAILETSGDLSVILKSEQRPLTPEDIGLDIDDNGMSFPVIMDGEINNESLRMLNMDRVWLEEKLFKEYNLKTEDVFYAGSNKKKQLFVSVGIMGFGRKKK